MFDQLFTNMLIRQPGLLNVIVRFVSIFQIFTEMQEILTSNPSRKTPDDAER